MSYRKLSIVACLALFVASGLAASEAPAGVVDIPFTKYVLDNGLTLVVHEDHKAPIVAVNVWYDVGSADEKPGKTGFAHLFEHLMFNGSENYDGEWFEPLEKVGATGVNGTTNNDRTNYFETVPVTALDRILWMESDRMGHLIGAITQEKLDEQRGVVQNEKRQGENQPYGKAFLTIFENTYPDGHPYDHSVIGSMADLDAASLEDVHEWFRTYYGPSNAVIAVVGDVEPEDVRARVEKYFGDIPPGPPLIKPSVRVEQRHQPSRIVMQDRVPQARVYKVWNVAAYGNDEVEYLDLASELLTGGKSSRLYKRLVYEDQIATDVNSFNYTRQLGGIFIVWATVQPGGDLAAVEKALDEEVARFVAEGPTADELERVQASVHATFVRGAERIGGFGGKSDILASGEVYLGSPDGHLGVQQRLATATPEQVQEAAEAWLDQGVFTLEIHPFPELASAESGVDRSAGMPDVTEFPAGRFPDRETAELANGMRVVLAQRSAIPVVSMELLLDAGYAADQFGKPGTANLAMTMLDEGTKNRSSLEISDELERLGARLAAGSNLDVSTVYLSTLKENLAPSLDLFADVILHPAFPEAELERLRKQTLAGIQREKTQPVSMAMRIFPGLLYGEGHAYGLPMTGSGTEESVASMTTDDLRKFHDTWFTPSNATMIVVGDISMQELRPALEKHFGDWQGGEVPEKNLSTVDYAPETVVYLVDREGSEQSILFAGHVAPPRGVDENLAIRSMNDILGGSFTARLNMNLREDKHWSYGARSILQEAAGQRPFFAYAPVQTDKTKEAMAEIQKEIEGIRSGGAMPPTADEVAKIQARRTLSLPGRWETNDAVLNDIEEMIRFDLPRDYWSTYAESVRSLTLEEIEAQADAVLQPDHMVWVVVGDREVIEPGIRELGLGEVRLLDADGKPIAE